MTKVGKWLPKLFRCSRHTLLICNVAKGRRMENTSDTYAKMILANVHKYDLNDQIFDQTFDYIYIYLYLTDTQTYDQIYDQI